MTRPRGFIRNWNPRRATLGVLSQVDAILRETVPEVGAITLRQLFYLMVVRFNYSKTERAYKRLCEMMNRARRAGVVDMADIRDDGLDIHSPDGWNSRDEFLDSWESAAGDFKYHRQAGQAMRLVVWCETQGMAPQLARAVEEFGVGVRSSGGFDSLTSKHNFAAGVAALDVPTVVLHIGDRDPSGEHIHMSLYDDLSAFVYGFGAPHDWLRLVRVAVTAEQVASMNLPTAPPKPTDNRSFSGLATQAEAIPPSELRRIIREEVRGRMDRDIYAKTLREEEAERGALVADISHMRGDK